MNSRALKCIVLAAALGGCAVPPRATALDLYLKGQLDAERGSLTEALASLTQAIDQNPQMGMAYVARGMVFKQQGDYAQAAGDFDKAAKLEPYNFNANFQLGLMYQYLKRFADAIVAYQKAVEIRPLDAEANMNLALSYTQMGQPMRGLPYALRAIQGNAQSAPAYANLGFLYLQTGNDAAAVDAYKRAIELNSHQPEIYVNLGQALLNSGKFDQARNVLETAKALAPSPLVSDRLGVAYYKLKDFDKAAGSFKESLRQDPAYYSALNGLGVVAMARALTATPADTALAREAIGYWTQSLQIRPDQEVIRNLVNKYTPRE
jgi:tetratricopeptide (TPR) repeat protein